MIRPFTQQQAQRLRQNLLQTQKNQNQMNLATQKYQQRLQLGNTLKADLKQQPPIPPQRKLPSEKRLLDTKMLQKAHHFQTTWNQRSQKAHRQRLQKIGLKAGLLSAAGASLAGVLGGILGSRRRQKKQQRGRGHLARKQQHKTTVGAYQNGLQVFG